ncbi:MAG TPA: sigma-70 family RNA polymerase sigma factor [Longimicrobiaceae bacterium]|nr:sigma-70 family RNA polymerase sigma factor [Longimicrobiaceae bacterium]
MDAPLPTGPGTSPEDALDAQLVERVRRGEAGAFDQLVARHMRRAFGVAYRLLGQREDAEDLVQEAFLAVLERIDTFQAGRSFAPWFYRILVNRGLNARKARALRVTEPIPETAAARSTAPDREAERSELREELRSALEALPERQRTIVELFELEGFSGPEIAGILDIPEGTVRWHLHEARRTMRLALAPFEAKEL